MFSHFVSYLQAVRCAWSGLPTLYQEGTKDVANPCLADTDTPELVVTPLDVKAGFALSDPQDPRHQAVAQHRARYGRLVHQAALALRENSGGEDHIDAVIGVTKAIEGYLLEYAMSRSTFTSLQKTYTSACE